jgi:hypothetical protein
MSREMGEYESLQEPTTTTLSTQRNPRQCFCKESYKPRYLKNKAAIIWNYLIMNLIWLFSLIEVMKVEQ